MWRLEDQKVKGGSAISLSRAESLFLGRHRLDFSSVTPRDPCIDGEGGTTKVEVMLTACREGRCLIVCREGRCLIPQSDKSGRN